MKKINQKYWCTLSGRPIRNIRKHIEQCLQDELALGHEMHVWIGTDGQWKSHKLCYDFSTVVVMRRVGKGGYMFINKKRIIGGRNDFTVREKMLFEYIRTQETLYYLSRTCEQFGVIPELHQDTNLSPEHESYTALDDILAYVAQLDRDFVLKLKPYAIGASKCSDMSIKKRQYKGVGVGPYLFFSYCSFAVWYLTLACLLCS